DQNNLSDRLPQRNNPIEGGKIGSRELDGVRVAIVLDTDFEQVEMTEPRKAFEDAGAHCVLISAHKEVTGVKHDEKKDTFKVDQSLENARPEDYDALLIPGGAINPSRTISAMRGRVGKIARSSWTETCSRAGNRQTFRRSIERRFGCSPNGRGRG